MTKRIDKILIVKTHNSRLEVLDWWLRGLK